MKYVSEHWPLALLLKLLRVFIIWLPNVSIFVSLLEDQSGDRRHTGQR